MVKTATFTPTLSRARRDAPCPDLRSRVEKILNVPHGREPASAGSGGVGENRGYVFGFFAAAVSLDNRFDHPVRSQAKEVGNA